MKCPNCHKENPDANKFCSECGTKLEKGTKTIVCPNCHQHIPEDSKFCPDCGCAIRLVKENPNNKVIQVGDIKINMIRVDGGHFMMGATHHKFESPYWQDVPRHKVTLSSYFIGETQVTQALWNAVMDDSRNMDDNKPVVYVSWFDCQKFIERLNQMTGHTFRLPTEAEWEFAARGGNKSKHYEYSGSDNLDEVAWYKNNSEDEIHNVKTKKANELGIYDMSGNVWEWCQDYYGKYNDTPQTNPTGPEESSCFRVIRGGERSSDDLECYVSWRWSAEADHAHHYYYSDDGHDSDLYVGFRLALR